MDKSINDSIDRPTERIPEKTEPHTPGRHVVQDSQSPYNEAQQEPQRSGDKHHPSGERSVQLPWGVPTDNLHPITQFEGDRGSAQRNAEVGAPSLRNQRLTKMQNEQTEREYQGEQTGNTEREYQPDMGRSRPRSEDTPGRTQDATSVRPKDNEDVERGDGGENEEDAA
jgi:hypothetical protein